VTDITTRHVYRVSGLVVDAAKQPVSSVLVKAFDRDFFRDQALGSARTDDNGEYDIRFTHEHFTGPFATIERWPDIFLRVYTSDGELLVSTESSVVLNAARDTRIDVTLPQRHPPLPARLSWLGGELVDLVAAANLSAQDVLAAYRYWRYPARVPDNLEKIRAAFPGIWRRRDPDDDCGEGGFVETVRLLMAERNAEADLDEADLDDFEDGVDVKEFFTQNVVVKYTIDAASEHTLPVTTPPTTDEDVQLRDGTPVGHVRANLGDLHADNSEVAPEYVQKVGLFADYALRTWIAPPFSLRDPRDGATRVEYRILNLPDDPEDIAGQTHPSWNHVEVDLDLSDFKKSFTVPHELLHRIQYRYNSTTTRDGIYGILREGGARFCVESINDEPNRYVASATAIFDDPGASLISIAGAKNPIRYAAGLMWKYLAEQHSPRTTSAHEPAVGVETYRVVLEETATAETTDPGIGYTPAALRSARRKLPWYGRFDTFRYYDSARTELDSHETTWANYLVCNYLHGTASPVSDRRFDFLEDDDDVPASSAISKLASLQSSIRTSDELQIGRGDSISRTVVGQHPWSARYYRISLDGASTPRMFRVRLNTAAGLNDPITQILRLGPDDSLVDIHRSDDAGYDKTISMEGLESVVVIVATRDQGGDFTVMFDEVALATDVMVTRWNTARGTEFEVDPRGWAWTWVSPDVMVDTDNDGLADPKVFFDQNNALKVRLRNRGNADATNITIDFWYQKATPYLSASAWIPVTDAAGVVQQVSDESLAQGSERWFTVDWAPINDGSDHDHWCVKVKVTASEDPNTDNKVALSNFSNVVVDSDSDLMIRYSDLFGEVQRIARGSRWIIDLVGDGDVLPSERGTSPCDGCGGTIIATSPHRVAWLGLRPRQDDLVLANAERMELSPNPASFYPADPRTLPPGVEPADLVTIAQVVHGEVVGGVTYRVLER